MTFMVTMPMRLFPSPVLIFLFIDAGRRKLDFSNPYLKMNLRNFIDGVKDPNSIQCILSAESPRIQVPDLIL